MKRVIPFILSLLIFAACLTSASWALDEDSAASDPISEGVINKFTDIYWGKSEMYPLLASVVPGTKLSVYEYDKDWVLVKYEVFISVEGKIQTQSFYGYVKRSDITCDPPLEGDASAKANTGPGKRKGKRPKPKTQDTPPDKTPVVEPTPIGSEEPQPTVEQMEEYDWIIRTPGMCNTTVDIQGIPVKCSFMLMAQKIGGTAASSDPMFNSNMHNPYAATAYFSVELQIWLRSLFLFFVASVGFVKRSCFYCPDSV